MRFREDKQGTPISILGYGCMRFTKKGGNIDYEKAEKELLRAYELGVNYYDTAYIYPGSEELLGKVLQKQGIRDKVMIATKLPQYMMKNLEGVNKTFQEELKRLQTDYIDYYLMHMFTDASEWDRLKSFGMEQWIAERKAEGSIHNIGFSYHGNTETFLKILEAYDWDFCQIQYNYLDEFSQAGRKGLERAYELGIPVIIMEPLRGGKLVNLPENAMKVLAQSGHHYSPAEWGLRWLWNQPGVTCVLSGMNSLDMVEENCRIASEVSVGEFREQEFEVIEQVKKAFREKEKVGCTGCGYCMPCSLGVDIPATFYHYNLMYMTNKSSGRFSYAQSVGMRDQPAFASQCVQCGKCEKHCPQHLDIRDQLKEADKELRPFSYRFFIWLGRKILKRGKKRKAD